MDAKITEIRRRDISNTNAHEGQQLEGQINVLKRADSRAAR